MEQDIRFDTTASFGMSGAYISLLEEGGIEQFQTLWAKASKLRQTLAGVEHKLRQINDPSWLAYFLNYCRRMEVDFPEALQKEAKVFENKRAVVLEALSRVTAKLEQLSPSLDITVQTLVGQAEFVSKLSIPKEPRPQTAKRNAIIKKSRGKSAFDICKELDLEGEPLLDSWTEKFPDITDWRGAYMSPACRRLLHPLISKVRAYRS